MLFDDAGAPQAGRSSPVLAVSQPAHAWIAGQLLRHSSERLDETLLLAAEQHDIAWLDWEVAPSFDLATGRPHFFRDVGAALHAPMWEAGVARALAAWGRRVALLVSRHGSVIYTRFTDRHRIADADGSAASAYLRRQGAIQAEWASALGLEAGTLAYDSALIAFADTLSLVVCGALPLPQQIEVPTRSGPARILTVQAHPDRAGTMVVDPWPFRNDFVAIEVEARPLPLAGRFANAESMHAWLAEPARRTLQSRLLPRDAV
jgi:hypothetical protein